MQFPKNVKITKQEAAALKKIAEDRAALQAFTQQVVEQGKRRMSELQQDAQSLWTSLSQKYNIDLNTTDYAPTEDYSELEAVAMRKVD